MGWLLFQIERKYTFDDLCNVRLKNVKFCKKSLYLAVDLPETLPAEYMNETLMADDEGYYNTAEFNTDIHVEDLQRVVSEKSARENNQFQSEYRVLLSLYLTTKPHFFNEPETNYSKINNDFYLLVMSYSWKLLSLGQSCICIIMVSRTKKKNIS